MVKMIIDIEARDSRIAQRKEDRLARIAELNAERKRELAKQEDAKGDKLKEKDLFDGELMNINANMDALP